MSDYRFRVDDYRLNYYPHDGVYDEQEGIDWSKVERIEIDWVDFVRERTCRIESSYLNDFTSNHECWYEFEMQCGYQFTWDEMEPPTYCPNCGAKVVGE